MALRIGNKGACCEEKIKATSRLKMPFMPLITRVLICCAKTLFVFQKKYFKFKIVAFYACFFTNIQANSYGNGTR